MIPKRVANAPTAARFKSTSPTTWAARAIATSSAGLFRLSVFDMGYPLSVKTRRFTGRGVRSVFDLPNGSEQQRKRPASLRKRAKNSLEFFAFVSSECRRASFAEFVSSGLLFLQCVLCFFPQ